MKKRLKKNKAKLAVKIRIAMIGGLEKYYLPLLSPKVASCFLCAVGQPEIGAVIFAKRKWEESLDEILVNQTA